MPSPKRYLYLLFVGAFSGLLILLLLMYKSDSQLTCVPPSNHPSAARMTLSEGTSTLQQSQHDQPRQRKVLLDCGANVASTVELFRNTYPGGHEFIIHSFEIDERLTPYFSPYENHHLHCPEGVAGKDGHMTAFVESAWSPNGSLNNGKDMQWGGGTLFVSSGEKKDTKTGGKRNLAVRPTIPTVDLSRWIRENTSKDDYVIFKLDVEGAEFDILKKMLEEDTFKWIDKYYGEFHANQPVSGWSKEQMQALIRECPNKTGLTMLAWVAERQNYEDFDAIHPVKVTNNDPGQPGCIYSSCGTKMTRLALTVAIGMNVKRARKVMAILEAYRVKIPVMLFVHGDLAELHPNDVKNWAGRFEIGLREDGYFPPGHLEMLAENWVRESLVSTELRLQEIDIQPVFYLPVNATPTIVKVAKKRGFRLIEPTVSFPPKEGTTLRVDNYYKFRDVERVPKALRLLNDKLVQAKGGILTLDTDLPDTRMNLVFLLDFLVENSGFELVSVADCVTSL